MRGEVGELSVEEEADGLVEAAVRGGSDVLDARVVAAGLGAVGEEDDLVERGHAGAADGVEADRAQDGLVPHAVVGPGETLAEEAVDHLRQRARGGVERDAEAVAFPGLPLLRDSLGAVVEEAGEPGARDVRAVERGEAARLGGDAETVNEALLGDGRAEARGERGEIVAERGRAEVGPGLHGGGF